MSSYSRYDFSESMDRSSITPPLILSVIAAWGEHGDYAEWSGGFLMALRDGRFAYLSGWCDTTGWGCQDGSTISYFDSLPALSDLETEGKQWDADPPDLNKWLRDGAPTDKIY